MNFSVSDRGILGKIGNRSLTYDLPITSSDALRLSYRRLVGEGGLGQLTRFMGQTRAPCILLAVPGSDYFNLQ